MEPVGQCEACAAQGGVAGADWSGYHAENRENTTNRSEPTERYVVDKGACGVAGLGEVIGNGVVASAESHGGRGPDEATIPSVTIAP